MSISNWCLKSRLELFMVEFNNLNPHLDDWMWLNAKRNVSYWCILISLRENTKKNWNFFYSFFFFHTWIYDRERTPKYVAVMRAFVLFPFVILQFVRLKKCWIFVVSLHILRVYFPKVLGILQKLCNSKPETLCSLAQLHRLDGLWIFLIYA